jgi:acetyl esterase/lipase
MTVNDKKQPQGKHVGQATTDIDPTSLVDPQLLPALQAMQQQIADAAASSKNGVAKPIRYPFDLPPFAGPPFFERMIPGSNGAPDVRIYVINAKAGTSRPGILHMHGGGYVGGTPLLFMRMLQSIAASLDCVIVTVDYRLAPATPYPGSLEDNYSALRWTYAHAEELGLNPKQVGAMGESAGGGHAAALAIATRDRGEISIAFQMLIYAMIDDRTGVSRPIPAHMGTFIWTPASNTAGWTALLGGSIAPKGAAAARVENLAGLPPTFIGVGSLDLLADEDIDYARRLIDAGIPTELFVAPGAYHGFDLISPDAFISKAFTAAKYDALRRAFGLKP